MPKRPRDPNQLAKMIVDIATGEMDDTVSESKRKPSGKRKGGLKGGKARAKLLTPQQREDIARVAAHARWKKTD
ncbi:MAG: histone H1 [Candidatus Acidiferrales bacterium]